MKAKIKVLIYLSFLFSIISNQNLTAQSGKQPEAPQTGAKTRAVCGTDESRAFDTPEGRAANLEFLKFIEEFKERKALENKSSNKTSANPNASKYIIPTVVHVIYGGNKKDSLSYEQVFSQFVEMYNDFRRVPGTRGYGGGVDMEIEFSLATKDLKGNPFNGIVYYKNDEVVNMNKQLHNVKLKTEIAPSWDTKKYFNIWLVSKIKTGSSGVFQDLAGFAQFPDKSTWENGSSEKTDGVVCINENFGNYPGGTSGRYSATMSHEIGHWLSHYHTFQGGCGGDCNSKGDGICDTPPAYSAQFKNPTTRINSCTDVMPGDRDRPDNPLIYMDYTSPDDACNTFTKGQRDRAQAALENPAFTLRKSIWSEENVKNAGAGKYTRPKANFWANNRIGCVNEPITMIDYSMSQPTKYEWSFPGGDPATSTEASPSVKYTKAGNYQVSLIISNETGISDTVVKRNFITISDKVVPVSKDKPFAQYFTSAPNLPTGWSVINEDLTQSTTPATWRLVKNDNFDHSLDGVKDTTIGCAKMNFTQYNQYNQRDHLVTPSLDLTNNQDSTLEFAYAYSPLVYQKTNRPKPDQFEFSLQEQFDYADILLYSDTLVVSVSTDCGATWKKHWQKGGRDLMTVSKVYQTDKAGSGGEYSATAKGEWKIGQVGIKEYIGNPNVKVRFETINGFGNTLYLDNIIINNNPLGNEQLASTVGSIDVMPNPFQDATNVSLKLTERGVIGISLLDLQGKEVYRLKPQTFEQGSHLIPVSTPNTSTGLYLLKININGQEITKKIVQE